MSESADLHDGLSQSRRMRSYTGAGSSSMTGSRPFLNLLNPLGGGRAYRGYERARDDVVEEEGEGEGADEGDVDEDRGEGLSSRLGWMRATGRGPGDPHIRMHGVTRHPNNAGIEDEEDDDDDGEVPQSFMIEARRPRNSRDDHTPKPKSPTHSSRINFLGGGTKQQISMPPRPSDLQSAADFALPPPNTAPVHSPTPKQGLDGYERALWNWVNVYNLDAFLQEVYAYYTGKGIYCIALSRILNLLTNGFVIGFSTFLLGCVDYSLIPNRTRLSDVIVPQCVSRFSGFTLIFFLSFGAFYLWNIFTFVIGIQRLLDMYRFYTYLLDIPDADIQTIPWSEVVHRIGKIREENPVTAISSAHASDSVTASLDAHDIANRIMRQENYLIALFNKEVLDLHPPLLPLRLFGTRNLGQEGKGRTLTQALEWNLRFCLLGLLFDQDGRVRKAFVTQKNRNVLIEALRRRFIFMGCLNAIFAPFIVLYLIMYSFFRYFEEYHKNPSHVGGRQYTPFAQWKFREFNELPHLFKRRLHESYPAASEYIEQFPNEKLALVIKFVSFIAGAFAAVLALASVVDPDLFVGFEITPHRTVLFYLGVFGSILAAARGMIPDDHRVYDTEELIQEVTGYTHYMPDEWKGRLHSQAVHKEFGHLFEMKIMIFLTEMLSVLLTPFILWFSLPPCSAAIVDFFREFTVHVDGLGYVCSFAVFDFKRHGNVNLGVPVNAIDERFVSKEGKMEKSFLNFKAANPDWNPADPSGSAFLSRLAADLKNPNHSPPSRRRARFGLGSDLRRSGGRFGGGSAVERQYAQAGILQPSSGIAPLTAAQGPSHSHEQRIAERARLYESALQKSIAIAGQSGNSSHRRSSSGGAAVGATAQDAVPLDEEDLRSELDNSYVDGNTRHVGGGMDEERDEERELADGGVMGLLTQIYDQRRRAI